MSESIEQRGNKLIEILTEWGYSQNPKLQFKYKSYQDFKNKFKSISKQKAFDKLERAYLYFVKKEKYRGAKPFTFDYFTPIVVDNDKINDNILNNIDNTPFKNKINEELQPIEELQTTNDNIINLNSKTDFLNNKMNKRNYGMFTNLYPITKDQFVIRRNPNYLSNKYFIDKVKPKHKDWERYDDEDLDGDKINDIAIYDKKGNIKYFNGYSINKIPKSQMDYSSYVLQKPEDDTSKTYLTNKPKKEPTAIKIFVDAIDNYINNKLTYSQGIQKNKSRFKQHLTNMINRYLICVYGLSRLNLDANKVNDDSVKTIEFYKIKGFKQIIKSEGVNLITTTYDKILNNIIQIINNNLSVFINDIVAENKNSPFVQLIGNFADQFGKNVNQLIKQQQQ